MIKIKLRTLKGVPYGLGVSMFAGEEHSWGLYHLEAISRQSTLDKRVRVRILC